MYVLYTVQYYYDLRAVHISWNPSRRSGVAPRVPSGLRSDPGTGRGAVLGLVADRLPFVPPSSATSVFVQLTRAAMERLASGDPYNARGACLLPDDEARTCFAKGAMKAAATDFVENAKPATDTMSPGCPRWGTLDAACSFNMMGDDV